MEQQLAFIQYQLWSVMGLLIIFVAGNIICYFLRKDDRKNSPEFGLMWDKEEIEELLNETESYLKKYPNHSSALYFRAKALISRKRYNEAKKYTETLTRNHPELKQEISELNEIIENKNS